MFGPVSPSEPGSGGTRDSSFLPTRQSQTLSASRVHHPEASATKLGDYLQIVIEDARAGKTMAP